jgi:hypothetical protein
MNRLVYLAVVLALTGSNAHSQDGQKVDTPFGITLGETNLSEAVFALGRPQAVYLAGADSEILPTTPTDHLLLVWESTWDCPRSRPVVVTVALAPGESSPDLLDVHFPADGGGFPTLKDLEETIGRPGVLVSRPFVPSEYDFLEAEIADCQSDTGEVHTMIWPKLGIEAYLSSRKLDSGVEVVVYSIERAENGLPPRCEGD